jgi:hypothetical protein
MRRLAWAGFAVWVLVAAVTIWLGAGEEDNFGVVATVALGGFAFVGALVAARQPANAVGWLVLAVAIVFALSNTVEAYVQTYRDPAPVAMWLDDWLSDVWIAVVGVWIPLLFPDGRLPSPRWRVVAWCATAAFAVGVLAKMLGDHVLDTSAPGTHVNPFALPGAAGDLLGALIKPAQVSYAAAVLVAMAGLALRLRRSRGVERQQLKWFAYVASLMLAALLVAAASLAAPGRVGEAVGSFGWGSFLLLVLFGLPAAIGIAILRHRLYDIDVVINRTLVYGALTATLGATYLALVLLIGLTVGRSNAAIAVSTLAVAALFRPLRARIQAAVDRRFYRRRYDAGRTLEQFGARLRDELDLETVGAHLRAAVQDTVQPTRVSLWLPRNDSRTHGP